MCYHYGMMSQESSCRYSFGSRLRHGCAYGSSRYDSWAKAILRVSYRWASVSTVLDSATKRQHKSTRFLVGRCTLGSVLRVLVFHDIPEGLARYKAWTGRRLDGIPSCRFGAAVSPLGR